MLASLSIDDCLIGISPNGLLILLVSMEFITLNSHIGIANEMLQQATARLNLRGRICIRYLEVSGQ